jgi:hypothetical protein
MVDQYTTTADETYFMQQEAIARWEMEEKIEFDATVVKVMEYCNVDYDEAVRIVKESNDNV